MIGVVGPRRVLVTGAGGFNGTNLVPALLAAGHEVVALVGRKSSGRLRIDAAETHGLAVLFGDLAEDVALPDGGIEAVVHTAAVSPGPGIQATVADFVRNNAEATRRLVLWARNYGVRTFVYFSSASVFGRITGPVLDDSSPRLDPDAYGVSKWMGEMVLREQGDVMASVSLRLPAVIGPGAVRNWLATMAAAAKQGCEIAYFHPDADYNNAVHVEDICRLVVDLLRRDLKGHDAITLGAAGTIKVREMVKAIGMGFGGRSPLREVPAPRPPFTISIARAQQVYGYQPMAMPDMVARFIAENRP
jgi:nucleoside-diphosphate-sugar epimerase